MTRRPTTRLAYCTGMRRWPPSTKTMKATPLVSDEGFFVKVVDGARQTDNDANEDDQRHTIANATFANLLAQPHDESGAGSQRENGHQDERWAGVVNEIGLRLQRAGDGQRLNDAQDDRQVARVLGNLLAAELAFFLQALKVREDHLHQLKDDGSGDVGHDAQRENGELAKVAAAEKVEEAQRRTRRRVEDALQLGDVDAGRGNVRTNTVHRQQRQREQDAVPQVFDAEHVSDGFDEPVHLVP